MRIKKSLLIKKSNLFKVKIIKMMKIIYNAGDFRNILINIFHYVSLLSKVTQVWDA